MVSVGGNDALRHAHLLDEGAGSVAEAVGRLAAVREGFARDYRGMLAAVLGRGLPTAVCTIYDGRFPDPRRQRLPDRTAVWAARLGIEVPPVSVVRQDKRWGSCDRRGRVHLNWQLVMAPIALIDYVVAHELCRIREHNHSRRFWRFMPDFSEKRDRLRVQGARFTL